MPASPPDCSHVHIRPLRREDADAFLALIDALADYEKLARPDAGARDRLIRDAFSDAPRYEAFLASVDGRDVGYAIIYETYSSFLALPTLYLEDIFVLPDARGNRAGLALFLHVAGLARARGCGRRPRRRAARPRPGSRPRRWPSPPPLVLRPRRTWQGSLPWRSPRRLDGRETRAVPA